MECYLPDVGTFSSPRVADLNGDGIGDIVMGAGREEFVHCDTAIFALDGVDGKMLWRIGARDQVFGSAALMDITDDKIVDVFIGGRSAVLKAIDGKSGELIWEFFADDDTAASRAEHLYNFYNPQFIPDQDGDGFRDILIANGGDVMVEAYDARREAGYLMIIGSRSGKQLAKAKMPDNKEIYMSAVVHDLEGDGIWEVIYGTGGETIGGHLYRTTLPDVLKEDLNGSIILAESEAKGFIAPPTLVDLNQDQIKDIVVNAVDGRIMAFDGEDNTLMWDANIPSTEVYSSPGVGDFTGDGIPDVFTVFAVGVWPFLISTRPLLIDGATGNIALADSIGYYQTSSPIIVDCNADGYLDALISVNYLDTEDSGESIIHNTLLVYDYHNGEKYVLAKPRVGSNVASTPWVGDLDRNGYMDIIYCNMTEPDKAYTFEGLSIHRLDTKIPIQLPVPWGSYMGSTYEGVYEPLFKKILVEEK